MKKYQTILAYAHPCRYNNFNSIITRNAHYIFSCGKYDFLLQKIEAGSMKYYNVIESMTGARVTIEFNSVASATMEARHKILQNITTLDAAIESCLSGRIPLNGRVRSQIRKRVYIG